MVTKQVNKPNPPKAPTSSIPMFEVQVEGTYWADAANNQAERRRYSVACKIPASRIASVNGLLKARLLPQILAKKDANYKYLRTFVVTSTTPIGDVDFDHLSDEQQIRLMDMKQLKTLILKKKIPVNYELYHRLEDLRTAVLLCRTNPEVYKKREEQIRGSLEVSSELIELNRDVEAEVEDEEPQEPTTVDQEDQEDLAQL